ncbi:NEDD8-specific protease 1-like, partial [Spinacia oleracea]|uniref:NEDD8-specific protease 1-like n=1 Tax=Spinacia oleracea TaxID=3562 RepID=A0A9R0JL53_SPIOL
FNYLLSSSSIKTDDDIMLVNPTTSLILANCVDGDDDNKFVEEFVQSNNLSSKRLVLFGVHDTDFGAGDDSGGGSHWSIHQYDRTKNSFMHYDSMEGVNNFHAMKLYDAIKEYMGPGGSEVSSSSPTSVKKQKNKKKKKFVQSVSKSELPKPESVGGGGVLSIFVECKTPQQTYGYDCGLYVLAIAREVCQWWSNGNNNKSGDMVKAIEKHVDHSVEVKMRSEVLEIIHDLTNKSTTN